MTIKEGWMQTYTKKKFYPMQPRVKDINIIDIAHALSNLCRYGGHCSEFYSVAQHCVYLSDMVSKENALWGLLHDASEAYIADIVRPVKLSPEFSFYKTIEKRIMDVVCRAYKLPPVEPREVTEYDTLMIRVEARDLCMITPEWEHYKLPELPLKIKPVSPHVAEELFLKRFYELKLETEAVKKKLQDFYEGAP